MKKEVIAWQLIALILGFSLLFIIHTYLENKIVIEAMNNEAETRSKRANCFMTAEEKNLNDAYCKEIDTSIETGFFLKQIDTN
jgi:hypothetical protein